MITRRDLIILAVFLSLIGVKIVSDSAFPLKETLIHGPFSQKKAVSPFSGISVEARAAVVWDAKKDKLIYSKNERVQLPLASLTKIMTALVALNGGAETAVISRESIKEEGDSGLLVGEHWAVKDLAKLTLVASANDGAESLAETWVAQRGVPEDQGSFVLAMNETAKSLDLSQTYFLNETGLDMPGGVAGGYGSAYDIARLFYHTFTAYPEVFGTTGDENLEIVSLDKKKHLVKNTNQSVGKIPGIIASKTGFTELSGGNLVVLMNVGLNHPLVIVVLGSTEEGRFADVEKLALATVLHAGKEAENNLY